jgi:uncharacterized SAM-binding protein YcdF (DUF218 family)
MRGLLALCMLIHLLLVFTPATDVLASWLIVSQPAREADAILCLGGDSRRLLWSAILYERGLAPVVVVSNREAAARAMADVLRELDLPEEAILIDDQSRVTADHPYAIADLPGIDPQAQSFVIVTDNLHSRRASACFTKAGYTDFTVFTGPNSDSFVIGDPKKQWRRRVLALPEIAYEYTALLKYWLAGSV